jgi:hypothetical protein
MQGYKGSRVMRVHGAFKSERTLRLLISMFAAFLLTGCWTVTEEDGQSSATTTIDVIVATYSAYHTYLPSMTPPPPTSTQTRLPALLSSETSTPTIDPTNLLPQYRCLDVVTEEPPANITMNGVWVLNTQGNNGAWLVSASNEFPPVSLPRQEGDRLSEFMVSPDRTRLLYRQFVATTRETSLIIVNADGESIWSQPLNIEIDPWGWFDNERLFTAVTQEDDVPYLILFNYAIGERQEIRADYPGYDLSFLLAYTFLEWRAPMTIYDLNLTRFIYAGCTPDCSNGYPVLLWDVVNNREITRLLTMDLFGSYPIWLPDYNQFLIAANLDTSNARAPTNDFYLVSRDGEINQLTHLWEYNRDVEIYPQMSLSPNGRYVAFWLRMTPSLFEDDRLAVLDIATRQVTNYCLPGETFRNNRGLEIRDYQMDGGDAPVWSPDSTQLIIIQRDPENRSIRWNVVIDLSSEVAIKIGEELEPVGWMKSP